MSDVFFRFQLTKQMKADLDKMCYETDLTKSEIVRIGLRRILTEHQAYGELKVRG